jgi:hypothetical protein
MTVQIGFVAIASLLLGLAAGYTFARNRRGQHGPGLEDPATVDEETRPTLVPFRVTREQGRNLARVEAAQATAHQEDQLDDQLDELLADLDKRR